MKIMLMGPVGSGKGTMAELICKKYNLVHISTGEIFRENIKNKTELGRLAESYSRAGKLVPDEVTNNLVADRLSKEDCKNGFVLDGYPRNLNQAKALDKITKLDLALLIDLSEDKIIERLSSRRMCSVCNAPTNIHWLVNGKCEKCGGEVYVRDDDKPEVIKVRLKTNAVSKDLIDYYKNKGIFDAVNSVDGVDENFALVEDALSRKGLNQ